MKQIAQEIAKKVTEQYIEDYKLYEVAHLDTLIGEEIDNYQGINDREFTENENNILMELVEELIDEEAIISDIKEEAFEDKHGKLANLGMSEKDF